MNKDGASLEPADQYKGLKNYDLVEQLREKYGDKVGTVSIGPAGEMKLAAASVAVCAVALGSGSVPAFL